jgi:hypothetical protein
LTICISLISSNFEIICCISQMNRNTFPFPMTGAITAFTIYISLIGSNCELICCSSQLNRTPLPFRRQRP